MIYGYLRVSSDEQDINSQKQGVDQFAKDHQWTIDKYITDEGVSGGKDPDKRNLGPLLELVNKDDTIICSEISRLGRDLYMVMDILHFCMDKECKIYTVKDKFVLGDDIQSKVLAFAFGLSAEIERQMIRQRTKEGLRLRMKLGILVGRPLTEITDIKTITESLAKNKEKIIEQYDWGVPVRRLSKNFNVSRNTMDRFLYECGIKEGKYLIEMKKKSHQSRLNDFAQKYKDEEYCQVPIEHDRLMNMILNDMTIPEIQKAMPKYTYEQVYDTILCNKEYNSSYRKHGQLRIKKIKI